MSENMNCGRYSKIIIIVLNFFVMICGLILLFLGAWFLADLNALKLLHISTLDTSNYIIHSTAVAMLSIGLGIFFISLLGCLAACKENRCLLTLKKTRKDQKMVQQDRKIAQQKMVQQGQKMTQHKMIEQAQKIAKQVLMHNDKCDPEIRRDAGYSERSEDFETRYLATNIYNTIYKTNFFKNCVGCCKTYLEKRNYTFLGYNFDCVFYYRPVEGENNYMPHISCYVKQSRTRNGKGQISTNSVNVSGDLGPKLVYDSQIFQLYKPLGSLTVGTYNFARMESIAIEKATSDLLQEVYLNFSDATLMELYRERLALPSLKGYFTLKTRVDKNEIIIADNLDIEQT